MEIERVVKERIRLRDVWDAAPEEKRQEARKKEARELGVGLEEVSDDEIIASTAEYICDIADVEIDDIDDIIDLIG